jgi:dienelactone hydrolase
MVILLFLCVSSIWAVPSFDGDWIGGFQRPESRVFVHAHFGTTNNETAGTIDVVDLSINARSKSKSPDVWISKFGYVPNTFLKDKPLNKLKVTASHAQFELADKESPMAFDGWVTNGVLTGMVQDNGMKLRFHLALTARINPFRYGGHYQVGPGHFITIIPISSEPFVLSFDSQSGQTRVLLPRSEADFVSGPDFDTFYPTVVTTHFITNQLGQFTALQRKPEIATAAIGTRIKALQEQEVLFTNGDVTLSGTLVLPPTKGPYPAVVLVSGSGPSVRNDLHFDADFFALNGVAALIYDKRGCGHSTGDWGKSGFRDLSGDALAGLEMLERRPDINPHQIGLKGGSQGGWLVGLAASQSKEVAFIISVSGPGITPEEQGAYCVEQWMKAAGYAKAEVNKARLLYLLNSRCQRSGSNTNEVEAAHKADRNKSWYNTCPYLGNDFSGVSKQWQLIWNYDPIPALHTVHCPVLAIFGGSDPFVPAQKSADIWKTALAEAGNHDVTIKIFPHADHGIAEVRTWSTVPDFFALQRDWLLQHVTVGSF